MTGQIRWGQFIEDAGLPVATRCGICWQWQLDSVTGTGLWFAIDRVDDAMPVASDVARDFAAASGQQREALGS